MRGNSYFLLPRVTEEGLLHVPIAKSCQEPALTANSPNLLQSLGKRASLLYGGQETLTQSQYLYFEFLMAFLTPQTLELG